MKYLCLPLLLGVVLCMAAAVDDIPEGGVCTPGSSWKKECNRCSCSPDGKGALCTLRACIPGYQPDPTEAQCSTGSKWKEDCNTCVCVNEQPRCTLMACDAAQVQQNTRGATAQSQQNTEDDIPPGGVCKPGSRWKAECNWCSCTTDGQGASCTLRGCLPNFQQDPSERQCTTGSKWKMDCNTCVCVDEKPRCTKRACVPFQREVPLAEDAVCKAGSTWKEECNWCRCANSGKVSACTMMSCPPGYIQDPNEKQCEEGSRWKKDECNWCDCVNGQGRCTEIACNAGTRRSEANNVETCTEGSRWRVECNWCTCSNGVGICTLRACLGAAPPGTPECEGNARWKKDCNWCDCVNGRGICTSKACGVSPQFPSTSVGVTVTREEAECTEGSRWRHECNMCRCNEGKGVCTKRACIPGFEPNTPECEGNSRWKKDCNWCDCVDGRGICTAKACDTSPQVHSVQVTVARDQTECTEGSRWRKDCNWCRCIEGRGVCTKRGCIPGRELNEPQCEGNARWKKDCNWCSCHDGIASCTEIGCIGTGKSNDQQENSSPSQCEEGSTWEQDCNRCRCVNGLGLCTKRLCREPPVSREEIEKPCINGTRWSQDCNRCSCLNGVSRCTKRLCRQPPVDPICNEPSHYPHIDRCRGFEIQWTFDSAAGECVELVYGGCGKTANMFESKAACEAKCVAAARTLGRGRTVARKPERCTHNFEPGPCFANFRRYGYNTASGRCEEFHYGGCQGNSNNFETSAECEEICGGGPSASDASCDTSKCPWKRWAHYIAKKCLPQYEDGTCCPTSFSCPQADEVVPDVQKCYYKGIAYEQGQSVPIDDECVADCRCAGNAELASVVCANIECPDLFRPPTPGCRPLYKPDSCCSYDQECGVPPEATTRSVSCTWNNSTFKNGDKMYFDDFPCQSCVCTPDFTTPTGPGCSKIDCGFNFRYTSRLLEGCVPLFFEEKCCPIGWICPGDSRIAATGGQQQQRVSNAAQCHLGELSFPVGTKVPTTECKINCQCTTPPELTCVQHRSCDMAQEDVSKDCPPIRCPKTCHTVTDALTGCPKCSCAERSFTCEKKDCPAGCGVDVDPDTGCPACQCPCPKDPSGQPPCPADCATRIVTDEITGCQRCECDPAGPSLFGRQQCPVYPLGRLPCPQDCAIRIAVDQQTGCEKCECDPANPGHPFGPPPPPRTNCRVGPDGRPPCPMDCARRYVVDQDTGCERCECDPNNPGHPFGPPPPRTNCRVGPDGRPPCPMDCAIHYITDPDTGCERCECDPANPGHPFGPPPPPPSNCRVGHDGRPPCPMDCARRFVMDSDTGCERCECDPTVPVHPFHPLIRPNLEQRRDCPRDHRGRAPCPMDCAVRYFTDQETGCEKCECDPDNPGSPWSR